MKDKNKALYPELEALSSQELKILLETELDKDKPNRERTLGILNILETRDRKKLPKTKKPKSRYGWLRRTAVAAAILLVFTFVVPPVFGAENIVELVGRWSQDLFALIRSDNPDDLQREYVFQTDHPGLQQLHDTVSEQGITASVVPMWIPGDCVLEDIKVRKISNGMNLYAQFTCDGEYILFTYELSANEFYNKYPKDDKDVKIYEFAETDHYIVINEESLAAVWSNGGMECSIITTYNKNILYKIIDSIYVDCVEG